MQVHNERSRRCKGNVPVDGEQPVTTERQHAPEEGTLRSPRSADTNDSRGDDTCSELNARMTFLVFR